MEGERSPAWDTEKGRDRGLGGPWAGRTSGFPGPPLLSGPGLRGRAGLWQGLTEAGVGRVAPGEQQGQVVEYRPYRRVPPVVYFFPDAAAGAGFGGVQSSNWSPDSWV